MSKLADPPWPDFNTSLRAPGQRRSIAAALTTLFTIILLHTLWTNVHSDSIFESSTPGSASSIPMTTPSPRAPGSLILAAEMATIRTQPQNVATLVEARPLTNLAPLILHFSAVLGPSWPIIVFTTDPSTAPKSASFARAIKSGQVTIQPLPANISFHIRDEVSEFLTSPWIWEALAPAPHVLLFQADSMICANSEVRAEDFLKYDFIGAPIRPSMGYGDEGMNGGLSLRNRSLILDIIRRWNWKEERNHALDPMFPPVAYEDQWFYKKMTFMNIEGAKSHVDDLDIEISKWGSWEPRVKLPTVEEAMKFSVESIWYERPLGYHQVAHWHWDRRKDIDRWCPEHRMATSEKISN